MSAINGAKDVKVGDWVDSPVGFSGRVSRVQHGIVYVDYSDKGGRSEGVYTPAWFNQYPGMLKKSWVPFAK